MKCEKYSLNLFTPRGLSKLQLKLQLSSSVTSQLCTLTVRFWAHSKAKSLGFYFRINLRVRASDRRVRPLQPPGCCKQLPARNELSFSQFDQILTEYRMLKYFKVNFMNLFHLFTTEEKCLKKKK